MTRDRWSRKIYKTCGSRKNGIPNMNDGEDVPFEKDVCTGKGKRVYNRTVFLGLLRQIM